MGRTEGTSFDVEGLQPGTIYDARVRAWAGDSAGPWSLRLMAFRTLGRDGSQPDGGAIVTGQAAYRSRDCADGICNVSFWLARPRTPKPDGSTSPSNDWVASSVAAGAGAALVVAAVLVRTQVTAGWVPMFGPVWLARVIVPVIVGVGVVAAVDGAVRAVRVEPAAG